MNNTPFTYLKPKSPEDIQKYYKLMFERIKQYDTEELYSEWLSTTNFTIENMYVDELKLRTEMGNESDKRIAKYRLGHIQRVNAKRRRYYE